MTLDVNQIDDSKNEIPLEEWFKSNRNKFSTRLYNILRGLCLGRFNGLGHDISPLEITEKQFFALKGAGKRSWEEFQGIKFDFKKNKGS